VAVNLTALTSSTQVEAANGGPSRAKAQAHQHVGAQGSFRKSDELLFDDLSISSF
jgi:hypothetical protein